MKEVILDENIKKKSADRIAMLTTKGVKPDRLERLQATIETNELPESGTFAENAIWRENKSNDQFSHLRIGVQDSDMTCSISCVKTLGSVGDTHNAVASGTGYRLKISPVNPAFNKLSQNDLASYLEGKKFTAKKVTVKTRPFAERKADEPARQISYPVPQDAINQADTKDSYEITIMD